MSTPRRLGAEPTCDSWAVEDQEPVDRIVGMLHVMNAGEGPLNEEPLHDPCFSMLLTLIVSICVCGYVDAYIRHVHVHIYIYSYTYIPPAPPNVSGAVGWADGRLRALRPWPRRPRQARRVLPSPGALGWLGYSRGLNNCQHSGPRYSIKYLKHIQN